MTPAHRPPRTSRGRCSPSGPRRSEADWSAGWRPYCSTADVQLGPYGCNRVARHGGALKFCSLVFGSWLVWIRTEARAWRAGPGPHMTEASTCVQTTHSGGFVDASVGYRTAVSVRDASGVPGCVQRAGVRHLRGAGRRGVGRGRTAHDHRDLGRDGIGRPVALVAGPSVLLPNEVGPR